jgi:hypothetical protein
MNNIDNSYENVAKLKEPARQYYKHYGRVGPIGLTKINDKFALVVHFYRKDIRNVPRTFRDVPVELRFGYTDPIAQTSEPD